MKETRVVVRFKLIDNLTIKLKKALRKVILTIYRDDVLLATKHLINAIDTKDKQQVLLIIKNKDRLTNYNITGTRVSRVINNYSNLLDIEGDTLDKDVTDSLYHIIDNLEIITETLLTHHNYKGNS